MAVSPFMNLWNRNKPYLILLLLIIIGYWQISFFVFSLKWDLIDVVLPFRYYFSECIQAGYFPFWNPYLQTGTPFFADLQAPTYYPELLIISLLGGYGVGTMHLLFILYLFIAASGMYRLSYYFNGNQTASLMAGLAYSFSGFMVGHGQHFFLLVGAAWIPFVVLNYIKMNLDFKPVSVLKTSLFLFLMVMGAYQALSIVLFYLIIILFLYYIIQALVEKNSVKITGIIRSNLLLLLIFLVLSLPQLISTLGIMDSVMRFSEGVDMEKSMTSGQSLKSFISFLFPYATLRNPTFFESEIISSRNHYFGIISLVFLFASLFRKRSIPEYLILGFGLLIMALSIRELPVREFFYKYIPLMDLFSNASYLTIFGLLGLILFSANHIGKFLGNVKHEKSRVLYMAYLIIALLAFSILISIPKADLFELKQILVSGNPGDWFRNLSFHQIILGQGVIQFVLIVLFIMIVRFQQNTRRLSYLIGSLFIIEVIISTQLNIPATVADYSSKPCRMQKDLSLCPDRFPIPANSKIIYNNEQHAFFSPFWRNTHIFTKQVSFTAFSSFDLNSYRQLDYVNPNLRDAVLDNHLVYFSDKIFSLDQFSDEKIDPQTDSRSLFLSEQDYIELHGQTKTIENRGHRLSTDSVDAAEIFEFSPNRISLATSTENHQFLTMLQTNFDGWKAYIDDQPTPIYTSNFNFRTILLPPGEHVVRFDYRNNFMLVCYFLSNVLFVMGAIFLLGRWIRKELPGRKLFIYIPVSVLVLHMILSLRCLAAVDSNLSMYEAWTGPWSKKEPIVSYHPDFLEEAQTPIESAEVYPGRRGIPVDENMEFLRIAELVNEDYILKNGTLVLRAAIRPENYPNTLIISEIIRDGKSVGWHGSKIVNQIESLDQWNDLFYIRNFYRLEENDVIRILIWNNGRSKFRIDKVSVDYY